MRPRPYLKAWTICLLLAAVFDRVFDGKWRPIHSVIYATAAIILVAIADSRAHPKG
jgi:hypothetical protein